MLGVVSSARGISTRVRVSTAWGWISRAPLVATITGVQHNVLRPVMAQPLADGLDQGRRGYHADLDRVGADVGEDRIQLPGQKFRGDFKNTLYAGGVLRRQGGDGGHGENAVHRHCLEIGLNTGASAGIASGDG